MARTLAGLDPTQAISTHQYQFDGTHRNRNECALCAASILLNLAAQISGEASWRVQAAALGDFLDRLPFRYLRVPGWLPGPGGATHPVGLAGGLRSYIEQVVGGKMANTWRPALRFREAISDLEASLERGAPTLIYGVGSTGIPHVVVPIGREEASWQILDPGYAPERHPMRWTDQQLQTWWRNYSVIYPAGTMISLERLQKAASPDPLLEPAT